ncbi:MAG: hypothetical protein NTU44_01445 [Bacteroidetes bacterium]|nr:hypothetical protein [Bacteroidota bacterium]
MDENLTIIIKNNIKMIAPVQAALHVHALQTGFDEKDCFKIDLLCEEIISNMVKFDFMPDQTENIEIEAVKSTLGMKITFKSLCIPLDIKKIRSYEDVSSDAVLNHNSLGLGTLIVKNLADSIQYFNKGILGQEIVVEKILPRDLPEYEDPSPLAPSPITEFTYHLRRLLPEDAPVISRLAYFAYKLSYFYEHIYFPERVKDLNETNELISVVAVNSENGEIIGHCANIGDEISDMMEMGVAFVNPAYRGSGCLNDMTTFLINDLIQRNGDGVFVNAVTSHAYSQKSAFRNGFRESAIFISRCKPLQMNAITEEHSYRDSLLFMVKRLKENYHKTVFPPDLHVGIIREIYNNTDIDFTPGIMSDNEDLPDRSEIQIKTDNHLCSHLFIQRHGHDIIDRVKSTTRAACVHRIETLYLYLPLNQWYTSFCCRYFEGNGYFFTGIRPGKGENDWLVLQYLNNQNYPYDKLVCNSRFGQRLLNYIKSKDPNQNS